MGITFGQVRRGTAPIVRRRRRRALVPRLEPHDPYDLKGRAVHRCILRTRRRFPEPLSRAESRAIMPWFYRCVEAGGVSREEARAIMAARGWSI